jgi:predicted HTH domain antitoxin
VTAVTARDLVEARLYESEQDVLDDALRYLLGARPDLRVQLAVHRYQTEPLSVARAASLAGVSWPQMCDILRERGVELRIGPADLEDAQAEVAAAREHLGPAGRTPVVG